LSLPELYVPRLYENELIWFKDEDFDGFTNGFFQLNSVKPSNAYCTPGELYSFQRDCDDQNPDINPNQEEVCFDGIDNNCDSNIDEGCDSLIVWYKDNDLDRASDGTIFLSAERPSSTFFLASELDVLCCDCDDNDRDIHPYKKELCGDRIDNNCDGNIDETCNFLSESRIILPETGQTSCYDETGNLIECEGTGQDGDILAGTTPPFPRYEDNGDGTFTDKLTGLTWLKNSNCSESIDYNPDNSDDGSMSWKSALDFIKNINNGNCPSCAGWFF
jgi:hypothetical protein